MSKSSRQRSGKKLINNVQSRNGNVFFSFMCSSFFRNKRGGGGCYSTTYPTAQFPSLSTSSARKNVPKLKQLHKLSLKIVLLMGIFRIRQYLHSMTVMPPKYQRSQLGHTKQGNMLEKKITQRKCNKYHDRKMPQRIKHNRDAAGKKSHEAV